MKPNQFFHVSDIRYSARRVRVGGMVTLLLALSYTAHAGNGTWLNTGSTDANWSTTSNWASGTVPGATSGTTNTDTATFNSAVGSYGTSGAPILIDAGRNLTGITFDTASAGGFFIGSTGGNLLSLTKNSAITMNAAVVNTQTIDAPLQLEANGAVAKFTNNATSIAAVLNIGGAITPAAAVGGTTEVQLLGSNTGANTASGIISDGGAASVKLTKSGAGSWVLSGSNTYIGVTSVTAGTLSLSGASGALTGTSSLVLSSGATFTIDDATANANRLKDSAGVTLNNGSLFNYLGSSATSAETTGAFTLNSGLAKITVSANGSNTAKVTTATGGFTRTASTGGMGLINGASLGLANSGQFVTGTAPAQVGTTSGGATGINAAVQNTKIALFLLGESGALTGQNGSATGTANTFLTYHATTGYRPLNPSDEFTNNAITTGNNIYLTTGTTTVASTEAVNSLVVNGGGLSIDSGATLTNTSGMLLFAQGGSISGAGSIKLGGSSNQESIIAVNAGVNATISAGLTSGTTGLTVYGPGTLKLSGANSLTGRTTAAVGSTLIIGHNNALGTSVIAPTGGTIMGEGQAQTLANRFSISGSQIIGGSSDLTFGAPASGAAVSRESNTNAMMVVTNTGTTAVTGQYSLFNSASGSYNNNSAGVRFGSSANLVITGAITDNNAGNVASGSDFDLVFTGAAANISLVPTVANNAFGAGNVMMVTSSGHYNTITVGGPGGAGDTITPFGALGIASNSANLVAFFKADKTGQILNNTVQTQASVTSGNGFGFVGENDLTLVGNYSILAASSFINLATGTWTFGGNVSAASYTMSVLGSGPTVFNAASTITGTTGNFVKTGNGTLTLSGTNNLTGNTTLSGGTVVLDYSVTSAGSGSNRLTQRNAVAADPAALGLSGVDLQLSGGSFAQTLGTPTTGANGTTLNAGQSKITQTNFSTATIALGTITRNAGGVIDFQTGVASTTNVGSAGILGGYATIAGSDWATGGGSIAALGAYDSFGTPGTNKNILQADSASVGATNVNSLKITTSTDAQALTIATSQILSLTSGGLLFIGAHDYAITGGTLKPVANPGDLVVHQNGSGVLTIDSVIGNGGGSSTLTKTGPGTLVLSNASNIYTGTTYLNGGVIKIAASGNLGTGALFFNGGTLQTTADFTTSRTVTLASNGGTFQVDAGTTLILNSTAVISGTSHKGLTKTGAGTLELQATNTFLGPVTVNDGTLKLGSAAALGTSSTTSNRSVAPVRVNGGTLEINGQTTALGNVTLISGNVTDTAGTGSLAAYSFTLQSGTVGAALADVVIASNSSNSINVTKTTGGTVILTGASTYSGNTNVNAGTLLVNNTSGSGTGTGQVVVNNAGTLGGNGRLAPAGANGLVMSAGAVLSPGGDSIGSTMAEVECNLAGTGNATFATGATLSMEIGTAGNNDKVKVTGLTDASQAVFNNTVVNFTAVGAVATGTPYTLFTFDAANNNGGDNYTGTLVAGTLPAGTMNASFSYNPTSITVTFSGGNYDSWLAGKFSAGELLDLSISGPSADPDGDGMGNLFEFLVGTEPKTAEQGKGSVYSTPGGIPTITLVVLSSSLSQTAVTGQSGTDLQNWPDAMTLFSNIADTPGEGYTTLVFKGTVFGTERFYRLELVTPIP